MRTHFSLLLLLIPWLIISCTGSKNSMEFKSDEQFRKSKVSVEEVLEQLPDYRETLTSAKGKGRAIVSEPGSSDRFTMDFESDREKSLLVVKNRLGIEGGSMLVDQDSILMYFKVDKIAQQVSVNDGRLTSLNELASVNLLDLLSFSLRKESVLEVYESEENYLLRLSTNGGATISKKDGLIIRIQQPYSAGMPYSEIQYENYGQLDGYTLPRKITILSNDGVSKVLFQVRSLELNPENLNLTIDIPSNIIIERL